MASLTLLSLLPGKSADGHKLGLYRCSCGGTKEIMVSRVKNGYTRSCGCLRSDTAIIISRRHGYFGTRIYACWGAMKSRCENHNANSYDRYGAVGIKVCARWSESFEAFLEDMGERPAGTSIDRIDWTRGYEPGNCRWATAKEQNRNKANFVTISSPIGIIPLVDYAMKIGITRGAAHQRLRKGKLEGCARV